MTTAEVWELLHERDEWLRRCVIIAHHHRDHADWGTKALAAYANGRVAQDLENEGRYSEAQALADDQVAWADLFELFLALSRRDDG